MRELGIYVHIPFCVKKCAYCDFLSSPASESVQEAYFDALKAEIKAFPADGCRVRSVFFGGGTPTLPRAELLSSTLDVIRAHFALMPQAEITLEGNPGTLTKEKLSAYRAAGFNRLSIGLQSADDRLLKTLGRIHTRQTFLEEYAAARAAGFDNINVDLMYGLPGQTQQQWEQTLDVVLALPENGPEHVSAYSLIVEEGTPFWALYHEDVLRREAGVKPLFLPDEEQEARMLWYLKKRTADCGMCRYEISNYAKEGRESVHNCGYWLRREYAGFGLGASGQLGNRRLKNPEDLSAYIKRATTGDLSQCTMESLSRREEMEETMFLGLRLTEGVDLSRFAASFGVRAEQLYQSVIEKHERQGLLERAGGHLRLTARGLDLGNLVMADFLLEDAQGNTD